MSKLTSFETDIQPLFTQRDIQAMSKAFNLANHVTERAAALPHSAAAPTVRHRGSTGHSRSFVTPEWPRTPFPIGNQDSAQQPQQP